MRRCTTHALYRSQLWQQDHCQHTQNANLEVSALESTAQRIGRLLEMVELKNTFKMTRTKEFIENVQEIIDETPRGRIWQISRDLGVSHTTVNACVKEDLCRSYSRQTSQILTEKTKNLQVMATGPLPSPSKCKSGRFNVHMVMKKKFPAKVMVFGVVSSEGHIMPPHIFEVGSKVNTKVYLIVLKSVVTPWCNQVAGDRPWVWQQDSAPGHKSKETQAWLQKECHNFVPFSHWPPPLPTWNRWTTLFCHTSITSPTWPPTTPKPAWSRPSAEYSQSSPRRLWKRLPVLDPYRDGDWGWRWLH